MVLWLICKGFFAKVLRKQWQPIAHTAPSCSVTFAASREPAVSWWNYPNMGLHLHVLFARSFSQIPFTCSLSASQQHKSPSQPPERKTWETRKLISCPQRLMKNGSCRWKNFDQPPCIRIMRPAIFLCRNPVQQKWWPIELIELIEYYEYCISGENMSATLRISTVWLWWNLGDFE